MLQARTAVLNNEFHEDFARWSPGFSVKGEALKRGKSKRIFAK